MKILNPFRPLCIVALCAGCAGPSSPPAGHEPSSQDARALSTAIGKIRVLEFTKPKSFTGGAIPDGLEVLLQTTDPMGDKVKVWGRFRFELYRYRPASGDRHGELVQHWDQAIGSFDDQARFWDRYTQTYRFQLGWEGTPLEPKHKYLLEVTFVPPEGERPPPAEFVFDFNPDVEAYKAGARPAAADGKPAKKGN